MDFLRDYAAAQGINLDALIFATGMSEEEARREAFTLELKPDGRAVTSSYLPDLNGKNGVWTQSGQEVSIEIGGETMTGVFSEGTLSLFYGSYAVVLERAE